MDTPILEILTELLPPFLHQILFDPVTSKAVFMLLMGASFAREIGKNLDQDIQADPWFESLHPRHKKYVKLILNVTHHWWIGWGIMILNTPESSWWFIGLGILIDDLPDIPYRYGLMEREPENKI